MSKTNHRRGFVDTRFNDGQRTSGFVTFSGGRIALDGTDVAASSGVASGNSRSIARDKAGAKKFIASRGRFHDRMGLQKIVKNLEDMY